MMKSKRLSFGLTKAEFLLTALGAVGVPLTGGIWVGSLHKQVQTQEVRIDKVEQAPLDIAVLSNKVENLTTSIDEMHADVKRMADVQARTQIAR